MPEELSYGGEQAEQQGRFLSPMAPIPGPLPPVSAPKPLDPALRQPEGFVPASAGHWRIAMRVTLAYLRWVQGLADHLGLSVTRTIQAALSNLAERHGYTEREPARFLPKRRCRPAEEVPPKSHG